MDALFWAKVEKNGPLPLSRPDLGPCWLWTGANDGHGYGHLTREDRTIKAYRYAYEICIGSVPAGLELDHLCRVPACVKPAHLEPVTHQENIRRGRRGGFAAVNSAKTHCTKEGHPLSGENLGINPTTGSRFCRACSRKTKQRWEKRQRQNA